MPLTRAVRVRFVPTLVVCLTLLPALSQIAFAQHAFESWTTENGLPQNSVNDIVQTRDGYLWLATFGGLVRFNGIRFVIFDRSTPGIESQRMRALYQDRSGVLWAGTEDGMLIQFDGGRFTTYSSKAGLPHDAAIRIEEDDGGCLWVTWMGRVTRFDGRRFETLTPDRFEKNVAFPPRPYYYDAWWGQDLDGLHVLVKGRVRTFANDLVGPAVRRVTPDGRGNLISAVATGQHCTSPSMTTYLVNKTHRVERFEQQTAGLHLLTPQERTILGKIARDKTSKEIAQEMGIAAKTVDGHRSSICRKLEIHGQHGLARFAARHRAEL